MGGRYKGEPAKPTGPLVEYFFRRDLSWDETVSKTHLKSYGLWEKNPSVNHAKGDYGLMLHDWGKTDEYKDLMKGLLLGIGTVGEGETENPDQEADKKEEMKEKEEQITSSSKEPLIAQLMLKAGTNTDYDMDFTD